MQIVTADDIIGQKVGILTSGGDSQGMNSAIRAAGRMCMSLGAKVYGIKWGYQGLVDGGEDIKEYGWSDFSKIIHLGGTILGSARCDSFRTVEGRAKAAYNLITLGIRHLIIIGGDGSLTGADHFRTEWPQHLENLIKEGKITNEQKEVCEHLSIVGMVGSIDNDFCGTDMTIGTDSALHRIIECADSIITTAQSHKRAFVLEIMGRHSGYLALSAGISLGADFVFIPEYPPDTNWKEVLCETVMMFRKNGKKYTLVLVAEGAQDKKGNQITSNMVKDVLTLCTRLETRVTILGHIQRGGNPSAFDRILGCRQGIEAAINVLLSKPEDPSYVICMKNNSICRNILKDCVSKCNGIKAAFNENNIHRVLELRGSSFQRNVELFKILQGVSNSDITSGKGEYIFGIMHVGAPASGMDPCTRAFSMWCMSKGYKIIGFKNGFEAFKNNDYTELTWSVVEDWYGSGGSSLGVSRTSPADFTDKVVKIIGDLKLSGLLIIGGYDSLGYMKILHDLKEKNEVMRIPIVLVPATICNNLPHTTYTLGSDTTINVIASCCDALRLSARSTKKRIHVVETMGLKCGYLATMTAVASAADNAYIHETSPSIYDLLKDTENLKEKFKNQFLDFGLLFTTDYFSDNYTTKFVSTLLNEEGKSYFRAVPSAIGYIQQGGSTSPFDRFLASKFGTKVAVHMIELLTNFKNNPSFTLSPLSTCMIGSTPDGYKFTPIDRLIENYDVNLRSPPNPWWFSIRNVLDILSHSDFKYTSLTIPGVVVQNVRNLQ